MSSCRVNGGVCGVLTGAQRQAEGPTAHGSSQDSGHVYCAAKHMADLPSRDGEHQNQVLENGERAFSDHNTRTAAG